MKKEDVAGIVFYVIVLAVAVVFGLTLLQPYFAHSTFQNGIVYALFILGAVAAGIICSALLYEIGHLIGAKAGNYSILSTCILYFTFYKEDEKWKFRFGPFDGLTGETKIYPKSEKSNPKAYLLLGTLFNSLVFVGSIIIFYLNKDFTRTYRSDLAYFFLSLGAVVAITIVYNILPIKLDSITDGYRLSMVSNPRNKEAFNELLRVEYEVSQGNSDVEIKTFTELTNFTADLNMNKVYILLDKEEYQEAEELVEIVLNNKENVSHRIYLRAIALRIFIHFFSNDLEEAKTYVSENVDLNLRREIFDDNSLISIRAYMLISSLADNSKSECLLSLAKVYQAYKRTPKNRRSVESTLFNKTLDLILANPPNWDELEKYRIVDDENNAAKETK